MAAKQNDSLYLINKSIERLYWFVAVLIIAAGGGALKVSRDFGRLEGKVDMLLANKKVTGNEISGSVQTNSHNGRQSRSAQQAARIFRFAAPSEASGVILVDSIGRGGVGSVASGCDSGFSDHIQRVFGRIEKGTH